MTSRIKRDSEGRPVLVDGKIIRTRPHVCGKNCPDHKNGESK